MITQVVWFLFLDHPTYINIVSTTNFYEPYL